MSRRNLLLVGMSLLALGLGVQLIEPFNSHMPSQATLALPAKSPDGTPTSTDTASGQAGNLSSSTNNSSPSRSSNKENRPALLTDSPERLSALAAITPDELFDHDSATLAARSQRSHTLNDRLEKRLKILKQRQTQASDAERAELARAIALLERNRDLRAERQITPELPRRTIN